MPVGVTIIAGQVRRSRGPSSASSLSGPPGTSGGQALTGEPEREEPSPGKRAGERRYFTREVRSKGRPPKRR